MCYNIAYAFGESPKLSHYSIIYNIITHYKEKINMRMRKKRHGSERISACADILVPKETNFTEILQYFKDTNKPFCLEIGCGKGSFAVGITEKRTEMNLLAVERVADVACLALEKAKAAEADGRIEGGRLAFYLNFSDPWPKKGYAKRRLTHLRYLNSYLRILREGGELRVKTDNDGLYEFTLEQLSESGGFDVIMQTADLHASVWAEDNVITEYESNFISKGKNINSVWAKKHTDRSAHE